jgi:hypothetical protein
MSDNTPARRRRSVSKARPTPPTPLTDEYMRSGQWNPLWDQLRTLDPQFVEAYAATTHLYAPGVRRHIANALRAGATREEVLETIQITTVMGIHSCNLAIPILCEEWERFEREQGSSAANGAGKARRRAPVVKR